MGGGFLALRCSYALRMFGQHVSNLRLEYILCLYRSRRFEIHGYWNTLVTGFFFFDGETGSRQLTEYGSSTNNQLRR